jgi:hypothetical protein
MKQCKECGKDFEPKNPKGIFCSTICKQKDYRKKIATKIQYLKTHGLGTLKPPVGKSIDTAVIKTTIAPPESSLWDQLKAIESEKLPAYIQSEQGRVFWQQAQRKKINDLKSKLKNQ